MVPAGGWPRVSQLGGTTFQVCLTRRSSQGDARGVAKLAKVAAARTKSRESWWQRMIRGPTMVKRAKGERAHRNTENMAGKQSFYNASCSKMKIGAEVTQQDAIRGCYCN